MKNEYVSFLNAYSEVANITPEHLPEQPDLGNRFGLTRQDFYDVLHEPRQISKKLLKELFTSTEQLLFLVGPRGSGKTTVSIKTVLELKKLNYYTLFISIPRHEANKYLDDRKNIAPFLRDFIYKDMLRKLFSEGDTSILQARFVAYLLCEDINEPSRPDVFNTIFVKQQILLKQYCQTGFLKFDELVQWLLQRDHWYNEQVATLRNELLEMSEVTHLSHAIRHFFKTEGQIIWIDNVDAFEQEAQNLLINAIFSIAATEPENIRFVVAAREENVLHFEHFYETQSSIRRSSVSITEGSHNPDIPGLHMPVLPIEHFSNIVKRRFDFSREFQKRKEKEARELLDIVNVGTLAQRQIAEHMRERFSPVLTDIRHRHLEVLSEKILKVFKSERVLHLANYNIRALLPMHCDFMNFLLEKDTIDVDIPSAFHIEESDMKTYLLYWMSSSRGNVANEFRCFNIVEHTRKHLGELDDLPGCYLPFVTLSCIWNLCLKYKRLEGEGSTFSFPTVKEVITTMEKLKMFSSEDIKVNILKLYDPQDNFTMFIAIESRHRLISSDQLNDNHRLRITYKGRAALSSLCNSFGFLLAMKKTSDGVAFAHKHLEFSNMNKYFSELLPDLIKIGEAHLDTLNRIRQNSFFSRHERWLDIYLELFGVPLEPLFSRSQKCCYSYGSEPKRAMYFDSLINSLESYAPSPRIKSKLNNLIDQYSRWLKRLENGDMAPNERVKFKIM